MSSKPQKKAGWQPRLSIRWKLLLPFVIIFIIIVGVLLPTTRRTIEDRIETEADSRLDQSALSVSGLIEQREQDALLSANFVANLPELAEVGTDRIQLATLLPPRRDELGLQELSFYEPTHQAGEPALFYGGPLVARRLQVSQNTLDVRDRLIAEVVDTGESSSGIAISPQSSQVIGAAPAFDESGQLSGIYMAVFFLDTSFVESISAILGIDIVIVKENAVIVSTVEDNTEIEGLISDGFIPEGSATASVNLEIEDEQGRLLAAPLVLDNTFQGTVLVSQSVEELFATSDDISSALFGFAVLIAVVSLIFGVGVYLSFARPLTQMAETSRSISEGDLSRRVKPAKFIVRDELTDLGENFNKMVERLQALYENLEQRVLDRTQSGSSFREASWSSLILIGYHCPEM
jgi:HAMP domain-containing protein